MEALELDPASEDISFIACFNFLWYLQRGHWARTATQPLRYASSFSDWRLYIWTYACLHISFAINFKMQRRASSYAWLLSYWSPYFWDGNHVRIGMSWWYCSHLLYNFALPIFQDSTASYSVKSWDYKNSTEMTLFLSVNTSHGPHVRMDDLESINWSFVMH